MITTKYYISTGSKSDFYTLWKEVIIDDTAKNGNRLLAIGKPMFYFNRLFFVQNLAKTKEDAIIKLKELGIEASEIKFNLILEHNSKRSIEAFGTKMKFNKNKWYAEATKEFFEVWNSEKEKMRDLGWSCWKYDQPRTKKTIWYMGFSEAENQNLLLEESENLSEIVQNKKEDLFKDFEKGMQVKVEGEVVKSYTKDDCYKVYIIKTTKGYIVERHGVIPVIEENGKKTTSFYALIKHINIDKQKIYLDRALKHPKKDLEITVL